jgi:diaminopimelate decarboxylase
VTAPSPGRDAGALDWPSLRALEREHGPSFLLLDLAAFARNCRDLLAAFRHLYPRTQIAYSYKTNYIPRLCREADRLGGYAEIVSGLEYELARRIGVDPRRIIFNGPLKEEQDLERALLAGSVVNLDATIELDLVERIAARHPGAALHLGLRCNFPLEEGRVSRFGLDVASGELEAAAARLARLPNAVPVGLHCHFSTGERSLRSYALRTRRLIELTARCFGPRPPRMLNIGGGYFSRMDPFLRRQFDCPVPSFEEYAQAVATQVAAAWPGDDGPELVLEPGAAVTGDVLRFVAKVIGVKRVQRRAVALVAGSIHVIKPTLHGKQLPVSIVRAAAGGRNDAEDGPVDLVGYTCMEHDCLFKELEGPVAAGDYAVFEQVGAYTVVMKPPFIRAAPAVLVREPDGSVSVARRAERFEDLFATYDLDAGETADGIRR